MHCLAVGHQFAVEGEAHVTEGTRYMVGQLQVSLPHRSVVEGETTGVTGVEWRVLDYHPMLCFAVLL